jgi:putative DNA primase/helicase
VDLFTLKLASSGLTLEDGEKLGFKPLTATEAKALCASFKEQDAVYLPYINPLTGQQWVIHEGTDNAYQYYRIRHVYEFEFKESPKAARTGFAALTKPKKPITYLQPPKTPPLIYYPPNFDIPWKKVIENRDMAVILTEGELKAAKACQMGFPTLSIAGVHSWQDKSKGITLIPSLKMLGLESRIIYVCFDSDYRTNPKILSAIYSLAEELSNHGAEIRCIDLPDLLKDTNKKTGLDDFFVYYGDAGIEMLKDLQVKAIPIGCIRDLRKYNERFVTCNKPACIVDMKLKNFMKKTDFITQTDTDRGIEQKLNKAGEVYYEKVQLNKIWLKWGQRRNVDVICYEPGKDKICTIKHNNIDAQGYNTWSGWAVQPIEGDVTLFKKLIDHLFSATITEGAKHWFMQWLAYPIQNPGFKMTSAVLLHGNLHGTGKSSVGEAMKVLYGDNGTILKKKDMSTSFTSCFADKSFVMVDDIGSYGNREYANELKELITASTLIINKKFVDQYEIRNVINMLFTSNDPAALYLEASDRRFFIVEAPQKKLPPEFFTAFYKWLDILVSTDGAAALLYYLMHYDLTGFNPCTDPPVTDAKKHMRELSTSDLGRVINDLIDSPENYVVRFNCDFATAGDILTLFKEDELATDKAKSMLNPNSVAKELSALGIQRYRNGQKYKLKNSTYRFYILRNEDKWLAASDEEVRVYLESTYRPLKPLPKRGDKF